MKTCFICRVNGSEQCSGPCGGCEPIDMCSGFDATCRVKECRGQYRSYGRGSTDFILACNICGEELDSPP